MKKISCALALIAVSACNPEQLALGADGAAAMSESRLQTFMAQSCDQLLRSERIASGGGGNILLNVVNPLGGAQIRQNGAEIREAIERKGCRQ